MQNFRVIAMGLPATTEEWLRAERATEADLPSLSEVQKRNAEAFRQSEQDYSRSLLLKRYAREREEREGQSLGNQVAAALRELGQDYRLRAVARRGEPGWHLLIEHPTGVRDLYFGSDVSAEVADSHLLKERIFREMGHSEGLQAVS